MKTDRYTPDQMAFLYLLYWHRDRAPSIANEHPELDRSKCHYRITQALEGKPLTLIRKPLSQTQTGMKVTYYWETFDRMIRAYQAKLKGDSTAHIKYRLKPLKKS